jgi:hypothetical protein
MLFKEVKAHGRVHGGVYWADDPLVAIQNMHEASQEGVEVWHRFQGEWRELLTHGFLAPVKETVAARIRAMDHTVPV